MQVALRCAVVGEHQQSCRTTQILLGRGRVVDHIVIGVLNDRNTGTRGEALAQVVERDRFVEACAPDLTDGCEQVQDTVLFVNLHARATVFVLHPPEGIWGPTARRTPDQQYDEGLAGVAVCGLDAREDTPA